jgi:hypothetical protein
MEVAKPSQTSTLRPPPARNAPDPHNSYAFPQS